jgi:hypothetical protein
VRALIPAPLFTRLVNCITADNLVTPEHAERIMTQALAFLQACAFSPGTGLAPSQQVDIGWHTLILYTRDYADFCQRVAGRFIHHQPDDENDDESTGQGSTTRVTVKAMRAAGLPIDIELWMVPGECQTDKCHQCHAGCSDSPK